MNAKKQIVLNVFPRDEKANLDDLRKQGWIPAILYGRGYDNVNLQVKSNEFIKIFAEAGESTLLDMKGESVEDAKVLIKEVQTDPVKDNFLHIDLYKIRMDEPIYTEIPLRFEGEAPAVKDLGGILVKNLDKVEVKCLPGDLVHDIAVDISQLKEYNDSISIKDLQAPLGIEFMSGEDVQIVSIAEPRKAEEEVKPEEPSAETEEQAESDTTTTEQETKEEEQKSDDK